MKQFFHKFFVLIAPTVFVLLVLFDQWTKRLAVLSLKGQEPFVIVEDVLEFRYFENTGAAWGMLKNKQILFYVLTVIFCVIVFCEIYRLHKEMRYMPFVYTLTFLTAGAAGNFIDRLTNQYVVDFIYFKLINFPIFNVADCYITVSVVVMLLLMFFYYTDEEFDHMIPAFFFNKKKD